jgi:hypothetical protein
MKIRVTSKVRALLVELDQAFERFHGYAATLADRCISNSEAMEAGANKSAQERIILGIAYRINNATKEKT